MKKQADPIFSRTEVAKILNVSALTISNREKKGVYPEPTRNKSNYREYSLDDIFNLQKISSGHVNIPPVIAVLHTKGYKDPEFIANLITTSNTNVTKAKTV